MAYLLLPSTGIWGAGIGLVFGQALAVPLFAFERRGKGKRSIVVKESR